MEVPLPWIDILLQNIKEEYEKPEPSITIKDADEQDRAYIQSVIDEPNSFDTSTFMNEATAYRLRRLESDNKVILAYTNEYSNMAEWFHIMRCLAKDRPAKVLYFGSVRKRHLPNKGDPVLPINVNGGFTNRCDATAIVIYRKEDAERVLIHELLHGLCSDPDLPIAELEANTEAWAEIIWVAFKAKGDRGRWARLMRKQVIYSYNQAEYVKKHHGVNDPDDYGWRYINGRISVWSSLGLKINKTKTLKKPRTLKLTLS